MKEKALFFLIPLLIGVSGCHQEKQHLDYSDPSLWARYESEGKEDVDTFFIAPTCSSGEGNMDINDEKLRSKFIGSVAMEEGI